MKNKKFILLLILLGVLIGGAAAGYRILSSAYKPQESTQSEAEAIAAPDFTVLNQNGEGVKLSDYFGKPIVLNFWATWCGPCKSELPAFEAAYQEYGGEVEFLMVNLTDGSRETKQVVESFIADGGYTFPVYFDTLSGAANAYSVYGIPVTYFIRSDGTIQNAYTGAMSEDVLNSYLTQLRGEESK